MNRPTLKDFIEQYRAILNFLLEKYGASKIESLMPVAAQIQRNYIENERNETLKAAFAVSKDYPSALEAIAIQFGTKPGEKSSETLVDAINNLKSENPV